MDNFKLPDISSFKLTPQEMNKVLYHRANLQNPGIDAQGNPVTIYASGIQIPEGPNKGKFVSVPGFVNGKIVEDNDALWDIWKDAILKNEFPIYNTGKELNKRDQELHKIMEMDMNAISPPPVEKYATPFYKDPFSPALGKLYE
jgi:hypothetical protein